ncbi:MAG: tetratricopeptide repeat protein [Deltaproteobacteria bacterium]|nr:tetratricopeptide repeat protein [Deltaproteobacteria bacterium]
MSLIFDALKKAEKDQQKNPDAPLKLPNPILQENRANAQKRILILLALLLISAGFLAYLRFFKKSSVTAQTAPTPITAEGKKGDSSDPNFLKEKATTLAHDNKLEEAQIIWQKLTLLLPTDSEVYNNLGFVLKKMGKKEEAYQAYHQALALRKEYPEASNNLGVLLLEDGVRTSAKSEFQKAISLAPNYADPHFNLALVLEQEGSLKEAADQYKTFLQLSPNLEEGFRKKIEEKITRFKIQ